MTTVIESKKVKFSKNCNSASILFYFNKDLILFKESKC